MTHAQKITSLNHNRTIKRFATRQTVTKKECARNLRFTNTNYPSYTVCAHFYEVCSSYKKEEK